MITKINLSVFLLAIVVLLSACKTKLDNPKPDNNGLERAAILSHYANEIILPAYNQFNVKFQLMAIATDSFIAQPNASNLSTLRSAWISAYTEWQKVELFDFGPAEKETLRNFYNIYPADTAGIQANILNSTANLEVPVSFAQQGFPALDYLVNGVGSDRDACLAFYTDTNNGSKRLAYLKRIVTRMNGLLGLVVTNWSTAYKDKFIEKTGLDIGSSTSLMVNGLALHYERFMRSGKFGIPSGAMLNGVIAPEKVEAFYEKEISRTLALSAHQAYVDFFNGKSVKTGLEGPSLKTYLNALDAKDGLTGKSLSQILNEQFAVCKSKMNLLQNNLYEEVKNNNQGMKNVFTEMQAAVRMIKVDMSSAMSITITFTDNDGD